MSQYTPDPYESYQSDLQVCQSFLDDFGSSYARATSWFPRDVREYTVIFYAFVRYADELIDNPDQFFSSRTHDTLQAYIDDWNLLVEKGVQDNTHPIHRACYFVFSTLGIPFDYIRDFFTSMDMDTYKERYHSYAELETYMWGSAGIVGHVMTYILGYRDVAAFEPAKILGDFMQLTNFLRDIDEDFQERNRIYLPQQDQFVFGVSEDMFKERNLTPELHALISQYCVIAYELFQKGMSGIQFLKRGHFQVIFASYRYMVYLKILERRGYNPFLGPMNVSWYWKIWAIGKSLIFFLRMRMKLS